MIDATGPLGPKLTIQTGTDLPNEIDSGFLFRLGKSGEFALPGFGLLGAACSVLLSGCSWKLQFPEPAALVQQPTPSMTSPAEPGERNTVRTPGLTSPQAVIGQPPRDQRTYSPGLFPQGNLATPEPRGELHKDILQPWTLKQAQPKEAVAETPAVPTPQSSLPKEAAPLPEDQFLAPPGEETLKPFGAPEVEPSPRRKPIASGEPAVPVTPPQTQPNTSAETIPSPASTPVEVTARKTVVLPSLWNATFESTQRRPILTARHGQGPTRILILASVHGNEPLPPQVLDFLADRLGQLGSRHPETTVMLIRTPNPDGLQANRRANSRGVDLNRNFPTADFFPQPDKGTGHQAGGEVETRVLMRLLTDFKPDRVIHIKSTGTEQTWMVYNQKAQTVAQMLADGKPLQLELLREQALPGSLESFVSSVLGKEMLTLAFPRSLSIDAIAEHHQPLLTVLLETGAVQPRAGLEVPQPQPLDSTPVAQPPREEQDPSFSVSPQPPEHQNPVAFPPQEETSPRLGVTPEPPEPKQTQVPTEPDRITVLPYVRPF